MKPYQLTGLTAEIANRIGIIVYRNSPGHTEAAALAVMSSMTGCRYYVTPPGRPYNAQDPLTYKAPIVQRNFILIDQAPSLADDTCSAAEMVMRDAGDHNVQRHSMSPSEAWHRSYREPGFLLLMPYASLDQLTKLDPLEYGKADASAKVLDALQRSKDTGEARFPHLVIKPKNAPDILPPSAHTILAAVKRHDLKRNLSEYSSGGMLGYRAVYAPAGKTVTNPQPETRLMNTELAKRISKFTYARRTFIPPITVKWNVVAAAIFTDFKTKLGCRDMERPFLPDWVELSEQIIDIAALLAIGDNADAPIIAEVNILAAIHIAMRGYWSYTRLLARNSPSVLSKARPYRRFG